MGEADDKKDLSTLRIFRSDGTACLRTFSTEYAASLAHDELMALSSIRRIDIVPADDPQHGLGLTCPHELPLEDAGEKFSDQTVGGSG